MRFILILLSIIFATPSFAQGIAGNGGSGVAGNGFSPSGNPIGALTAMSAQGLAPRRHRMVGSISSLSPVYQNYSAGTTFSYMEVTPIEGTPYAFKIGIAEPFAGTTQVLSAAVYFSDSYGDVVAQIPSAGRTNGVPTANSVYLTCTTVNGNATVTCPGGTGTIPSGTVYAVSPTAGSGVPPFGNVGVTVVNSTTVTLSYSATSNWTGTIQFYNIAPECKLYWDYGGADNDMVNNAGTNRSITLTGNPAQGNSLPINFSLAWSDFVPCTPVARTDGGTQYLAFIIVTLGPNTTTWAEGGVDDTYSNGHYLYNSAAALGGRYVWAAKPWTNGGTDYTDNPQNSTGWGQFISPMLAFSYLTDDPGWNILQTGDSVSTAPTPLAQFVSFACKTISTPLAPCEYTSTAYGGSSMNTYDVNTSNNINSFYPSALVLQPISRNDGVSTISFDTIWARGISYAQQANIRLGAYGAIPLTTTLDGNSASQAMVSAFRARLNTISKSCQPSTGGATCPLIPVLDFVPYVSRAATNYAGYLGTPGNFWDYLAIQTTASAGASAGATSISITAGGAASPCYANDILTDQTTPTALSPTATVTASSASALTVTNTSIIGSGVQNGDLLTCSYPGYTGGYLSTDNTHPSFPAITLMQPQNMIFIKQLLGLQ